MAFIINCKRTSCNNFLAASLVVSLMMLAPLKVSSAPYAGCPDNIAVPSDPSTQEQIEKVVGGVEILIELGSRLNGTILNLPDFQNVRTTHPLHGIIILLALSQKILVINEKICIIVS